MSSLVYIVALRDASIQIYTTALQGLWYLNNSNSMSEKTEVDVLLNSETAPCQEFPSVYQWRYKWISHFFFCHLLFSLSVSIVKPTRYTNVSNLFYFGMTRYMFRTVFPSIISSSRLYIQQQTETADCLLASGQQYLFDICLLLYVQSWTPDDGRKDRPKHVECHSKIK